MTERSARAVGQMPDTTALCDAHAERVGHEIAQALYRKIIILAEFSHQTAAEIVGAGMDATDSTSPEDARRIEAEHTALLAEIETENTRICRDIATRNGLNYADFENLSGQPRRAAMMDALVERETTAPTDSNISTDVHMNTLPAQSRIAVMGEVLFHRISPSHVPSERSREFVGLTIPEMARRVLEGSGHRTVGFSSSMLIERALHSTSDFPLILGETVGRVLRDAYGAAPSGIKQVARKTSARDFRAKRSLTFSEAPRLEKVNEAGEFKRGTFEESEESYKVETFGKIFGITRQALVNDSLDAFSTIPRRLGQAASAFEAQTLSDLLASNPAMRDGKAVFHADHKNLAAVAAAIDVDSVSKARAAMRDQVGLTGELISVTPRFIVVPSELGTAADKLVAAINPTAIADANVFAGRLKVVVEPRLTDPKAWYIAAEPGEVDGIEYAYLEGYEGAQIDTRAGFDVDGIEIRVRLDFGAGWIDHRGWHKNAGV